MRGLGVKTVRGLKWAQKTYLNFPLDPVEHNYVRSNVNGAIFSVSSPTPVGRPMLVCYSKDVVTNVLDLDESLMEQKAFVDIISGCSEVPESKCLVHRYGGHQFGSWAGQLGDGRAHLIGEYYNRAGERWELQLKGSGLSPYSRFADGRAVVSSSVREFLCSEAMHHLGVPTSRAATLVVSGDSVVRDPHYDGRPRRQPVAVLLRLAPCWFRFGSLQMLAADGDPGPLRLLADFICERHLPAAAALTAGARYIELARQVALRTARTVAAWESVGFTHGVMNTDNMSVLGITIDYGPFGFLDRYDRQTVSNSSDVSGVYRHAHQARVALWNVCRLCEALLPLLNADERGRLDSVLEAYSDEFATCRRRLFAAKLGLSASEGADQVVAQLLQRMEAAGCDFTMTFRQLADVALDGLAEGLPGSCPVEGLPGSCPVEGLPDSCPAGRLRTAGERAGAAPQAAPGALWALRPLATWPVLGDWVASYRAELARQEVTERQRRAALLATNPRYVLRQWMAHRAAQQAEQGDYGELRRVHRVLERPFSEDVAAEEAGYADPPPDWAHQLSLSCSS